MSHLTSEERQRLINSIPEASLFDAHKENIMPRKEGRSAASLCAFLELSAPEKEQELKQGHLKFKEELERIDELDDPLAVHVNYIHWILEHYPLGHTKDSNLLPTLKLATESFVDDVRYKQHPSYLKVCLEYAKWVEDPAEIYRFLMGREIGQNLALFYEEYAGYLERKMKYEDAETVFQLGLDNNARPRDRLERNYHKLKNRLKERERKKSLIKPPPPTQQRSEQTAALKSAGRTMLGVKYSSESRTSQPSNVYNGTQHGTPTPSSSSSIGRDFSGTPSTARSKDSIKVYKETSPSESIALPTGVPKQLSVRSTISHSENKIRADYYTGVTIKQAPFTPPPTKKFSIYRDNDSPNNSLPPSSTLQRGLSFTSESSETATTTTHSIRKQPLSIDITTKRTKKPKENPVSQANLDRFNMLRDQYIQSTDSHSKREIIACFECPPSVSFEELRAERYRRKKEEEQRTSFIEETHYGETFFHERNDMRASSPTQELTSETLFARNKSYSFFGSDSVPADEEDVTWTREYQIFEPVNRDPVDENAHP